MTDPAPAAQTGRRSGDQHGVARLTCWVARRAGELWDWIDKRDIDKHVVSLVILLGTIRLTQWAEHFATAPHAGMSGTDIAAIVAAVTAPYMALQAAAIGFYFKARQ